MWHNLSMRMVVFFLLCVNSATVVASDVHAGVAANFATTFKVLKSRFEMETGYTIIESRGSSGKLYAQIRQGAPFDVFLSADAALPLRLENEGLAVKGSRFSYALGRLVLWSATDKNVAHGEAVLRRGAFRHLALANPKIAPYGAAAKQALVTMDLWEIVQGNVVYGENVAQTYQFVATANAELGFVALAQVLSKSNAAATRVWEVPQTYYQPIRQDAVVLNRAKHNRAATQFMRFLKQPAVREVIEQTGYGVP